jgi:predicted dehydrogenase
VKSLIDQGELGKILMVSVNCFWNRNAAYYEQSPWRGTKSLDGGTLYTQFSHFVDIIYYLFGEISNVNGVVKNVSHQKLIEFEDSGSFSFEFEDGGIGNFCFTTSTYKQNMEGSITIFAENATIKIGGKYLNTIDYQKTNGFDIQDVESSSPANNYGFYEGSMSNHDKVIDNVI